MFDLNTILSAALQQAVEAHLTQLRQEYANKMGELARQLEELESRQRVSQDAHVQRIEALEERGTGGGLTRDEVREIANEAAEDAITGHCSDYDHDDFVSDLSSIDLSDHIDLDEVVRDAVKNLSFEVSVN